MRLVLALSLAVAAMMSACGRIGFDTLTDASGFTQAECPSFAVFCDGFETDDVSRWSTTNFVGTGTVTVQSAIVHSGRFALDASMPNMAVPGDSGTVDEAMALSTGLFAVRAWIYQPQPLIDFDAVMRLVLSTNFDYVLVGGDDGGLWVASESGSTGIDYHSTTAVVEDSWLCVELDYVFTPGPPSLTVYVDDVNVISSPVATTMPTFDTVELGVARTAGDGSTTIIDDVVMATQHIGCM